MHPICAAAPPAAAAPRPPPPAPPRPPRPPRPDAAATSSGGMQAVEGVGASPVTPPGRIAAAPPRPPAVARAAPVRVHWYCPIVQRQREPAASTSMADSAPSAYEKSLNGSVIAVKVEPVALESAPASFA